MGNKTRSRINFFRKRGSTRKISLKKVEIIISISILIVTILSLGIFTIAKFNINNDKVTATLSNNVDNNSENKNDQTNYVKNEENSNVDEEKNEPSNNNQTITKSGLKFTILGEIMMGGQVSKNLNYIYTSAFKDIYYITRDSDFTFAPFSTNITNLTEIDENAKSNYVVTKDIISGLSSLGIDAVSVSNDHMIDFSSTLFKSTVDILEKNNIYVSGISSTPVYLEKNGIKIAIISSNNVIIGTSSNYLKNNINTYKLETMTNDIRKAKQNADIVVVDMHWGRDNEYGVTAEMKQIAKNAVDAGADLVVGSHALGIYPIVEYKGKAIIYSTGYLMTDSDMNLSKENYIFDVNINIDSIVESISLTPIYIMDKKQIKFYYQYDKEKADAFCNKINEWNKQNGLNSDVVNGKIEIKL
ncbi:MAG: CapA family protein [Clostridia bacterium]|nr:CapA family protein [Clostridia bacterium]